MNGGFQTSKFKNPQSSFRNRLASDSRIVWHDETQFPLPSMASTSRNAIPGGGKGEGTELSSFGGGLYSKGRRLSGVEVTPAVLHAQYETPSP